MCVLLLTAICLLLWSFSTMMVRVQAYHWCHLRGCGELTTAIGRTLLTHGGWHGVMHL